jgi:hypothetical protein
MKKNFLRFAIIFCVTVASYAYALNNGFIGDDILRIQDNPELGSLSAAISGELADRPLLMMSAWLDNILGLTPALMRLVTIFLHALVAFELYLFIEERSKAPKNSHLAFGVALLFALHPLHSQSVHIIIQRGLILATLFGILSIRYFFKYILDDNKQALSISVLTFILALLSKPIVFFLPVFYLIAGFRLRKKGIAYLLPYLLSLGIPVFFYLGLKKNIQDTFNETPLQYFLIQVEVLFTYFRLMFFPYGLKYLYDVKVSDFAWIYLLAHILILTLGLKFLRDRLLWILFCGFYLSFLPESSFFPIIHPVFEHRTYFPLIFLFSFFGIWSVQSSYSKTILKIIPLMAIFYLGLNQLRNFQIKPVLAWKKHTLQNSSSYHNFNIGFTLDLIRAKDFKEADKNLILYERLYPGAIQYEILRTIYELRIQSHHQLSLINKMTELVVQSFDGEVPRNAGNRILVEYYSRPGTTIKDQIILEHILSLQMKTFFGPLRENFKQAQTHYYMMANEILKTSELESLTTKENILKIKAILQYYFAESFPGLREEVESELLKNPNSEVLTRLKQMVR